MPKKIIPIDYTNRDFTSIKEGLVEHARRYYPDTYKDFNEGSFGSLMLDTVSYIGDIMSFYLDYQANESFLDTSIELNNLIKIGRQLGYKFPAAHSSFGTISVYLLVPANSTGTAPDMNYAPILKKGSLFSSVEEGGTFYLQDNVDFADPKNEIRVGQVDDTTGVPTSFAIKAYGEVVSGNIIDEFLTIGDYEKFLKRRLEADLVTDIIEIVDSEGNEYYEVDYLSQDVIYRQITNRNEDKDQVANILKPFRVPRRFTVERDATGTYLQFGASSQVEVDTENRVRPNIADPSSVVLQRRGRLYLNDSSLDPYKLIESDEFGVAPSNTTLRVTMRVNDNVSVNASVNSITDVIFADFEFKDENALLSSAVGVVRGSIEITNEEQITGSVKLPSTRELKARILGNYATQNRAVTMSDYKAMAYSMPPSLGAVRRVSIYRDADSLKRNLNMYVLSDDVRGNFSEPSSTLKQNIKTWLLKNKMVNDTIDILPAKVINLGIKFEAVGRADVPKFETLQKSIDSVIAFFNRQKADIGEPFFITDVYQVLKEVEDVVDVTNVNITLKTGGLYSDVKFNIYENTSSDGRYINIPKNCVYEIKFPNQDIKGIIK
jgi:hypothetical protein